MTVASTRASTDPVNTDGSTRTWGYNFRIDSKADARLAIVDGNGDETYPDPSLWNISGLGEDSGGNITYPIEPASAIETGYTVRIDLQLDLTQPTDLLAQGAYSPVDVERALDRVVRQIQILTEEKNRIYDRVLALIALFPDLEIPDIGNLSDYVTRAETAAAAAAESAADAADSASSAGTHNDACQTAVETIEDQIDLVDSMLHGADEYEPGKATADMVLAEIQGIVSQAPSTNGRTIGDHTGEAGSDGVTQEFEAQATDLGAVVRFVRANNRPAKYKLTPDLFNQTNAPGFDEKFAIIRVVNNNEGTSTVTLEGPADPSAPAVVLLKPTVIAQQVGVEANPTGGGTIAAHTLPVVVDIPAGSNRKVKASACFIGITTPSGPITLTSGSGSITNITVRGTDGGSSANGGSDPLMTRLWTADVSGTASIDDVAFNFALPTNCAGCVCIVQIIQNASGHEDYVLDAKTDEATTADVTVNPSEAAGNLALVDAFWQGADALTGLTISGVDTVVTGKTPLNRTQTDIAYAIGVDEDRATGSVTYAASSSQADQRAVAGIVFLPVEETVGGSGEDNLYYAGASKVLDPLEQADILVHNSGLFAFLSRADSP